MTPGLAAVLAGPQEICAKEGGEAKNSNFGAAFGLRPWGHSRRHFTREGLCEAESRLLPQGALRLGFFTLEFRL